MKTKLGLCVLLSLVGSGCASLDMPKLSQLTPTHKENEWQYYDFRSIATPDGYGEDLPTAEKVRMDYLKKCLKANGCDINTLEILDRQYVRLGKALMGEYGELFYKIRVK